MKSFPLKALAKISCIIENRMKLGKSFLKKSFSGIVIKEYLHLERQEGEIVAREGVPVKIKLKTDILQGEERDTFELIVFGRYYQKKHSSYLIYNEVIDSGTINTTVKWGEMEAQITRRGALNMKLSFLREGRKNGSYETEIGTFLLETYTQKMTFHWNEMEKSGIADLKYKLFMEQIEVGTYHLSFEFKEDPKI